MKNISVILYICLFGLLANFSTVLTNPIDDSQPKSDEKEPWDMLEAVHASSRIKGFNGTWISGNEILYRTKNGDYMIFNATSKTHNLFASKHDLDQWQNPEFKLFPDKKRFLVRYDTQSIFRYSKIAKYDIYDIETKISTNIGSDNLLQFCIFSPKRDRIAYVFKNNVHLRQPDGKEYQLTFDGEVGKIYNGIPDWVYEEEVLSTASALWWSPDGEKLAIGHFNDIDVKTFKYILYGDGKIDNQYPEQVELKYPKPGTPNPKVELKVTNVKNIDSENNVNWEIIAAPDDIVTKDHILNSVTWSDNENLLIIWMNRRQNHGIFMLCKVGGTCRKILNIDEPKGWLLHMIPDCSKYDNTCTMINWIGNWLQAWNLNLETGENKWKSQGDFTVLEIYGYKTGPNNVIYYQATLANNSASHHVFRNKYCLSCTIKDIDGTECTQASASFSTNLDYYAITCRGPSPSYTKIFNAKTNREIENWETNSEFRDFLKTKQMPNIKYLKTTVSDGLEALIKLYLPPSIDWDNRPKDKKYPLIVDVYGGPNSAKINEALKIGWPTYLVTQRDVVYAYIESRGTGNKGRQVLMSVNNHLGDYEVIDQINITNYLHKTYDIFDTERFGLWGWSYGGYVTAMTIAKDYNSVFQCGISVAPVISWTLYDSIYTERYMGLPTEDDNILNYVRADITENINNFKNHDFLLIHGVADDNVHVQNSMMLSKALQKADIIFDEMLYPDENHSIGNLLPHLYHTMDEFWITCLNLDTGEESNLVN